MKRVLVIDDDPDILTLLKETLEANHFECHVAASPQEGLETAIANKPHLILLDLMLPGMSGFGFMRELKKHKELAATPIVVLTALSDEEIAEESLSLGAKGYLSKACNAKELVTMVQAYSD
ncbi:MAG TPA: response regulator [bacterium]|nr:response regulator [bacterium]